MSLPQGRRATPEAGSRKTTALAAAAAAGFGLLGTATSFVASAGRSSGISSSASVTAKGAEAATTSLRGPSVQPSNPEGPRLAYAAATAVGAVACAAGARRRGRAAVTPSSSASAFTAPVQSSPVLAAGVGATEQVQHGSSTTMFSGIKRSRVNGLTAKMWRNPENKRYIAPGKKYTTGHYRTGPWRAERRWELFLKYSQKFSGRRRNVYRIAKEAVMKALKQKYRSRRMLKKNMRTTWVMRLNANCRLHGTTYSLFICRLKLKNIWLNRKILSQLAIYDRPVFTSVMNLVEPDWPQRLHDNRTGPAKNFSAKEIDAMAIPWLERQLPAIYTDTNVRFNRKVADHGAVEYTVDFGDPAMWRTYLPQTPELANFDIPDHWVRDANRGQEPWKLDYMEFPGKKNNNKDYIFGAQAQKANQLLEMEKKEKGEENRLTKEGSREDWYKEDPQSWFDN